MNTSQAAEKANVSVWTIRRWCRTGRIHAAKAGQTWVIEPASLPTQKEITMERFVVVVRPLRNGGNLYEVRDSQNDNRKIHHGFDEQDIRAYTARMNAEHPAAPAPKQVATTGPRDAVSEHMAGAFGLRSHARPGECHYCGLDARTCDCN